MRMTALLVLSCFCATTTAPALSIEPDCNNAASNADMSYCAGREFERTDSELNKVYKDTLDVIAEIGGSVPAGAREWEEKFRESQRAWIAFRDADCDTLTRIEWGGGSGTGLAISLCKTELTKARIKSLRARYLDR